MKKAILLLSFLPPLFLFAQADSSQGVKWTDGLSWEQVKQKAKMENKFIFIDAFATWCGPCKKMDKDVYTVKSVGDILNPQFISIKVQMDKTEKDKEEIKKWYLDVQKFNEQYGIEGYPSFLFFDSNGKLIHKDLGWKDVPDFVDLVKEALTDPEARYQCAIKKFNAGQLDYLQMPDLARQVLSKKDVKTSIAIVKEFKEKYLDKLGDQETFTKANLSLLVEFIDVVNSTDRYFHFIYNHADLVDSIVGRKQTVENAITIVILREELRDKIYNDDKPIVHPKPRWGAIHKSVMKKYGSKYYDKLFPYSEIYFYDKAKDSKNMVKYIDVMIKKHPPEPNSTSFGLTYSDAFWLNNWAWKIFEVSDDKRLLKRAMVWADLAINSQRINANAVDTKANLLYKIGNVKEAIELQQTAVELTKGKDKSKKETLEKMKAGLPTWPVKNG